nr:hypothetical protein [Tanacetum cinerariifolium]
PASRPAGRRVAPRWSAPPLGPARQSAAAYAAAPARRAAAKTAWGGRRPCAGRCPRLPRWRSAAAVKMRESYHQQLVAGEGRGHHHERAFGQVEVGKQRVSDFEIVGRVDELVIPALGHLHAAAGRYRRIERPHGGGANGANLLFGVNRLVDNLGSLG